MTAVQLTLLVGFVGVLLCAVSDVVLLGSSTSGGEYARAPVAVMRRVSPRRLLVGHVLGVFSLPLAVGGLVHLYAMIVPVGRAHAVGIVAVLAWMFAVGTAFHGSWAPMGHADQLLAALPVRADVLAVQRRYWTWLCAASSAAFVSGGVWFGVVVAGGWTSFPPWYAAFTPVPVMIALQVVASRLPSPIGGWVLPGLFNLTWVVTFGVPLVLGWRP